jgi:hypothetical protein
MDREEIIRMAREAGFRDTTSPIVALSVSWEQVEQFAALVAAAEREACAKVCDGMDHNGVMIAADCATAIRARGQL